MSPTLANNNMSPDAMALANESKLKNENSVLEISGLSGKHSIRKSVYTKINNPNAYYPNEDLITDE